MKTFLTVTGVLVSFAAWALVWRDTVRSKQAKPWYVRHPIGWLKGFGTASMGWFALMVLNWDEIEAQERARKKAAAAAVAITPRAGSGVALAVLPVPAPPATVAALPDYEAEVPDGALRRGLFHRGDERTSRAHLTLRRAKRLEAHEIPHVDRAAPTSAPWTLSVMGQNKDSSLTVAASVLKGADEQA